MGLGFCLSFLSQARAAGSDEFQGAWVVQGMQCSDVFTMRDGKPAFKTGLGDELPGFILSGGRAVGLAGSCNVSSSKRSGDTLHILMTCASQIAFTSMKVSLKLNDPNSISRIDPDFPEISTNYSKCPL